MRIHRLTVLVVVGALVLWGGAATAVHAPVTDSSAAGVDDGAVAATGLQEDGTQDNGTQDNETQADASVTFDAQNASDGAVTVQNVTVPEGGYVAIHDSSLLDGNVVGSVVGVSDYLEPGTHENVTVTLYADVIGAFFTDDSAPSGTETYIAMPHEETENNGMYEFVATNGTEDGAYTVDGEPVVGIANVTFGAAQEGDRGVVVESLDAPPYASTNSTVTVNVTLRNTGDQSRTEDVAFRLEGGGLDVVVHENVTVAAGETANVSFEVNTTDVPEDEYIHGVTTYNSSEFATITVTDSAQVDFDDQASDDANVTVEELFVPEGGYVVIHDSSLLDGNVAGSVVGVSEYLEAGYHQNVNVTLFAGVEGAEFANRTLGAEETLIAMPHQETSNNTVYDFVATNGSEDGAYVADGSAVVDQANVTNTTAAAGPPDDAGTGDDQAPGNDTDTGADDQAPGNDTNTGTDDQAPGNNTDTGTDDQAPGNNTDTSAGEDESAAGDEETDDGTSDETTTTAAA